MSQPLTQKNSLFKQPMFYVSGSIHSAVLRNLHKILTLVQQKMDLELVVTYCQTFCVLMFSLLLAEIFNMFILSMVETTL